MTKEVKKAAKSTRRVKFYQFASAAGKIKKQKQTLTGLGLGKIHSESELEDTAAVRGMAAKVQHLVREVK